MNVNSITNNGIDRSPFTLQRLYAILAFALLILAVVVPNSLRTATAVGMVLCFLASLPLVKWNSAFIKILGMYLCSALVTVLYLLVGINHGAPFEAVVQVLTIYLISPLLWIFIAAGLARVVPEERLATWFIILGYLCVLTVGLFYFLYLSFGASSVTFFKESANVNVKEGYAGATMFVYGSLIFLTGGLFASPGIIKKAAVRNVLLGGLAVAAATSGRSALIFAVPIGSALGLLLLPRSRDSADPARRKRNKTFKRILLWLLGIFVAGGFLFLLAYLSGVDIALVSGDAVDELLAKGGIARSEQGVALLQGISDTTGLGAGHGVGVSYIRSDEFPWRYELVWLATLFRVGILGTAIYLLPFATYARRFLLLAKRRDVTDFEIFMFSGFLCSFLASSSNPYIEAFSFQWMYVVPVVYFLLTRTTSVRPRVSP